jgi:serine/threonine-protein kinase
LCKQIAETKSVNAQSDIYSLGVVLWQMAMGKKPYDSQTISNFQLQTKIVNEPLPQTNTIWDSSIQKATQKEPSLRYKSCKIWQSEIENLN